MPALNFEIEWPNGEIMECYSPSTIVLRHFQAGDIFTIDELTTVVQVAFEMASDRVEERFGFRCAAAAEQRAKILRRAECFESSQSVQISAIREHSS